MSSPSPAQDASSGSVVAVTMGDFAMAVPEARPMEGSQYLLRHGQSYSVYLVNLGQVPCDCRMEMDGRNAGTFQLEAGGQVLLQIRQSAGKDVPLVYYRQGSPEALADAARAGVAYDPVLYGKIAATFTPLYPSGETGAATELTLQLVGELSQAEVAGQRTSGASLPPAYTNGHALSPDGTGSASAPVISSPGVHGTGSHPGAGAAGSTSGTSGRALAAARWGASVSSRWDADDEPHKATIPSAPVSSSPPNLSVLSAESSAPASTRSPLPLPEVKPPLALSGNFAQFSAPVPDLSAPAPAPAPPFASPAVSPAPPAPSPAPSFISAPLPVTYAVPPPYIPPEQRPSDIPHATFLNKAGRQFGLLLMGGALYMALTTVLAVIGQPNNLVPFSIVGAIIILVLGLPGYFLYRANNKEPRIERPLLGAFLYAILILVTVVGCFIAFAVYGKDLMAKMRSGTGGNQSGSFYTPSSPQPAWSSLSNSPSEFDTAGQGALKAIRVRLTYPTVWTYAAQEPGAAQHLSVFKDEKGHEMRLRIGQRQEDDGTLLQRIEETGKKSGVVKESTPFSVAGSPGRKMLLGPGPKGEIRTWFVYVFEGITVTLETSYDPAFTEPGNQPADADIFFEKVAKKMRVDAAGAPPAPSAYPGAKSFTVFDSQTEMPVVKGLSFQLCYPDTWQVVKSEPGLGRPGYIKFFQEIKQISDPDQHNVFLIFVSQKVPFDGKYTTPKQKLDSFGKATNNNDTLSVVSSQDFRVGDIEGRKLVMKLKAAEYDGKPPLVSYIFTVNDYFIWIQGGFIYTNHSPEPAEVAEFEKLLQSIAMTIRITPQ